MGLANVCLPADELDATVQAWAEELCERSPTALAIAKRSFNMDTAHQAGIAGMGLMALKLDYARRCSCPSCAWPASARSRRIAPGQRHRVRVDRRVLQRRARGGRSASSTGIEAGVVYVNRRAGATTGAWPGVQPFGGWKGSGSSGKASGGLYYVQQFMREQSRTIVH